MRKILNVFSEDIVNEMMAICDPWSSSSEVTEIEVKDAENIYREDEVILINSNGLIVVHKIRRKQINSL